MRDGNPEFGSQIRGPPSQYPPKAPKFPCIFPKKQGIRERDGSPMTASPAVAITTRNRPRSRDEKGGSTSTHGVEVNLTRVFLAPCAWTHGRSEKRCEKRLTCLAIHMPRICCTLLSARPRTRETLRRAKTSLAWPRRGQNWQPE